MGGLHRPAILLAGALGLAACSDSAGDGDTFTGDDELGTTGDGDTATTGDGDTTTTGDGDTTTTGDGDTGTDTGSEELVWPNAEAPANSDPWLVEHHDEITKLRPRVLALNFVNQRSMADMQTLLERVVDGFAEGSRYHGYLDAEAPPVLEYQLAYAVDLRDDPPPEGWPYNNSTLYPREEPQEGYWSFDYEQLFTAEFGALMGIVDPDEPDAGPLPLCELVERGLVHEVWIYGDADVPDVSAAEVLGIKPHYDAAGNRLDQPLDRCAGNGCFDDEDLIPESCTRSLRIGWVNNTRGPGCYLHSGGHGMEWMARGPTLPMLKPQFEDFADFNLDQRYATPFTDWYACPYGPDPCLTFTSDGLSWNVPPNQGVIDPYLPHCGNVHFAPNARGHYDNPPDVNVMSTCTNWWSTPGGVGDAATSFHTGLLDPYASYDDCGGPWQVWWMQSWPGLDNDKLDPQGQPVRSWWPYLFY